MVAMELSITELPVELNAAGPKKPKAKVRRAMNEAAAFAKFGVHVLRVKAKVLASLGKEAEIAGIKHITHGRIIVAADNAETAIAKVGEIVDKILKAEAPDYDLIANLMRLQKELNAQLLKTAEAHFSVDKQPPPPVPPANGVTVAYPPGTAVMVASELPAQEN